MFSQSKQAKKEFFTPLPMHTNKGYAEKSNSPQNLILHTNGSMQISIMERLSHWYSSTKVTRNFKSCLNCVVKTDIDFVPVLIVSILHRHLKDTDPG